jgi:hypothetical protein
LSSSRIEMAGQSLHGMTLGSVSFLLPGPARVPYNDNEHRPRADGMSVRETFDEGRRTMSTPGYPKLSRVLEGWLILAACGAVALAQTNRSEGDSRSTFSPAPARQSAPPATRAPWATAVPAATPLSPPTQASPVSGFPLAAPGLVERATAPSPLPRAPAGLVVMAAPPSPMPRGRFSVAWRPLPPLPQSYVTQAQPAQPYPNSGEKPALRPMAPASPVTRLEAPPGAPSGAITGVVTPRTTL